MNSGNIFSPPTSLASFFSSLAPALSTFSICWLLQPSRSGFLRFFPDSLPTGTQVRPTADDRSDVLRPCRPNRKKNKKKHGAHLNVPSH